MNQKYCNKRKHGKIFIKITARISDRFELNIFDLKAISILILALVERKAL